MRKILLTGKNGQVGWELQRTLAPLGQVIALDVEELDFCDPDAIRQAVRSIGPDIIVNPAAYDLPPAALPRISGKALGLRA